MESVEDAPVLNATELNTTVLGADNATNLTGRAAATTEGMIVTYSALFVMALGPIFLGSLRSVAYHSSMRVRRLQGPARCTMVKIHWSLSQGFSLKQEGVFNEIL